jgi:NTE family protein
VRHQASVRRVLAHRKIDRFVLISGDGQESIGAATDFSRSSTRRRIERGYRDAMRTLSSGEAA